MADKRRVFKVAEKIRALLSAELHRVSDPRVSLVTITSVVVSPDLRQAKVYWTVSGGQERIGEVEGLLEDLRSPLRRSVGAELGTRFVPELKFFYDETLDTMEQVERLFQKIHAQDEQRLAQKKSEHES